MPNYRFLGTAEQQVARIGKVLPGQVYTVTEEIGEALEHHDGENWELVKAISPAPAKVPAGKAVHFDTKSAAPVI